MKDLPALLAPVRAGRALEEVLAALRAILMRPDIEVTITEDFGIDAVVVGWRVLDYRHNGTETYALHLRLLAPPMRSDRRDVAVLQDDDRAEWVDGIIKQMRQCFGGGDGAHYDIAVDAAPGWAEVRIWRNGGARNTQSFGGWPI